LFSDARKELREATRIRICKEKDRRFAYTERGYFGLIGRIQKKAVLHIDIHKCRWGCDPLWKLMAEIEVLAKKTSKGHFYRKNFIEPIFDRAKWQLPNYKICRICKREFRIPKGGSEWYPYCGETCHDHAAKIKKLRRQILELEEPMAKLTKLLKQGEINGANQEYVRP
jgi:hypothetical protein